MIRLHHFLFLCLSLLFLTPCGLAYGEPSSLLDEGPLRGQVNNTAVLDAFDPKEQRRARLLELFEQFNSEPDVQDVQAWAVERARAEPSRASELLRNARGRGALPLIRLRGRYEDQSGTKWDELNLIDSRDRDSEYTLDLWLEWDLAELASGPDALRAVREGRALAALRQGVVNQVNIAFFDRRRLLAEEVLADEDEALATGVLRRLRIEELIATLDGLTGGRWTLAQAEKLVPPPSPSSRDQVASEQNRDFQGEDPDSGLRVPVHPADSSAGP